jgi:hypothetical protein
MQIIRLFCLFAIAFYFQNCNENDINSQKDKSAQDYQAQHLEVIEGGAKITFFAPMRYDTSFYWIYKSDCGKPCDRMMYRYQPTSLRVIKESGFLESEKNDTIYDRFTISHSAYIEHRDDDTTKNEIRHAGLKANIIAEPMNPPLKKDSFINISGRYFSIFEMNDTGTVNNNLRTVVLAITIVKGNELRFQYEFSGNENRSMNIIRVEESWMLLKRISIK